MSMSEYKTFGELSKEEKLELIEAYLNGEVIEFRRAHWELKDRYNGDLKFYTDNVYRIAPRQDEINWDHVNNLNFMARGADGKAHLYEREPDFYPGEYWMSSGVVVGADNFSSYKRGTTEAKDSLVRRPE